MHKSLQHSSDSVIAEHKTSSAVNISTETVTQELHGMGFHGQAAPIALMSSAFVHWDTSTLQKTQRVSAHLLSLQLLPVFLQKKHGWVIRDVPEPERWGAEGIKPGSSIHSVWDALSCLWSCCFVRLFCLLYPCSASSIHSMYRWHPTIPCKTTCLVI